MESIKSPNRIHPLMAAAAASVVIVSLAGTAAITGLLPNSRATVAPAQSELAPAAQLSALPPAPLPLVAAAPQQQYLDEPAPAPVQPVHKAPAVKHHAPHHVAHHNQVARNDYNQNQNQNQNYSAPAVQQAAAPAAPNYVGIGVGAVGGGLLGHQVGGGNGKKLATVAGAIGGGMLGNQIANGQR